MTYQNACLTKWKLIYHEMLAINNLKRELSGFHRGEDINLIHNLSDHATQAGEKNVQLLIDFILKHEIHLRFRPIRMNFTILLLKK